MTLTLDFQGHKFWNSRISAMAVLIDVEWKGYESVRCWSRYVTLTFDLTHDLDLEFSRSDFLNSHIKNGRASWHTMKWVWVDRVLDPVCDLDLWLHPWPWPWIFKIQQSVAFSSVLLNKTAKDWSNTLPHKSFGLMTFTVEFFQNKYRTDEDW